MIASTSTSVDAGVPANITLQVEPTSVLPAPAQTPPSTSPSPHATAPQWPTLAALVDDTSDGFSAQGYQVVAGGYGDSYHVIRAGCEGGQPRGFAGWSFALGKPGRWRAEAFIPDVDGLDTRAHYWLSLGQSGTKGAYGFDVNQAAAHGTWVSLGDNVFRDPETNGTFVVRVFLNYFINSEASYCNAATSDGSLAADAVRWTYIAPS
jgi:hypothetical protein